MNDVKRRVRKGQSFMERFGRLSFLDPSGCRIWKRPSRNGYGYIWHENRNLRAHRAIWERTNGPIPDGLIVCHHCDNRACVNVDHMFLGTDADNAADRSQKGRSSRGAAHRVALGTAKLTREAVMEIWNAKPFARGLAKKFGVSKTVITRIRAGKSYRDFIGNHDDAPVASIRSP